MQVLASAGFLSPPTKKARRSEPHILLFGVIFLMYAAYCCLSIVQLLPNLGKQYDGFALFYHGALDREGARDGFPFAVHLDEEALFFEQLHRGGQG